LKNQLYLSVSRFFYVNYVVPPILCFGCMYSFFWILVDGTSFFPDCSVFFWNNICILFSHYWEVFCFSLLTTFYKQIVYDKMLSILKIDTFVYCQVRLVLVWSKMWRQTQKKHIIIVNIFKHVYIIIYNIYIYLKITINNNIQNNQN